MKSLTMKTIIILLMIFVLYACDESTVTQPKVDTKVETQKYTLEEILADTNWVEVDTVQLNNTKFCIAFEQGLDTVLKISNLNEYNYFFEKNLSFYPFIKDSSSSCYLNYETPDFDFAKYDKFINFIATTGSSTSLFKIYYNKNIRCYVYYREIKYTEKYKLKNLKYYIGSNTVKKQALNTKVYYVEKIIEYKE